MIISITHLRIRSPQFLLPFLLLTFRCIQQMKKSAGFIKAGGFNTLGIRFYTVSLWENQTDMQNYIVSGAHKETFSKSQRWCSEISVGHIEVATNDLPQTLTETLDHLKKCARFMPLPHANRFHQKKELVKTRWANRVSEILP